jgi:hypothetical protein
MKAKELIKRRGGVFGVVALIATLLAFLVMPLAATPAEAQAPPPVAEYSQSGDNPLPLAEGEEEEEEEGGGVQAGAIFFGIIVGGLAAFAIYKSRRGKIE